MFKGMKNELGFLANGESLASIPGVSDVSR